MDEIAEFDNFYNVYKLLINTYFEIEIPYYVILNNTIIDKVGILTNGVAKKEYEKQSDYEMRLLTQPHTIHVNILQILTYMEVDYLNIEYKDIVKAHGILDGFIQYVERFGLPRKLDEGSVNLKELKTGLYKLGNKFNVKETYNKYVDKLNEKKENKQVNTLLPLSERQMNLIFKNKGDKND
jgi:hypothetical protein